MENNLKDILRDLLNKDKNLLNRRDELIAQLGDKIKPSMLRDYKTIVKVLQNYNVGEIFLAVDGLDRNQHNEAIYQVHQLLNQTGMQEKRINFVIETFVGALGWTDNEQVPSYTYDIPINTPPPVVDDDYDEFIEAYNDIEDDEDSADFVETFNVKEFICSNSKSRRDNLTLPPEFDYISRRKKYGVYWALDIGDDKLAVVPQKRRYGQREHDANAMGEVFDSNYQAGNIYEDIEVYEPAIFSSSLNLIHKGNLILKGAIVTGSASLQPQQSIQPTQSPQPPQSAKAANPTKSTSHLQLTKKPLVISATENIDAINQLESTLNEIDEILNQDNIKSVQLVNPSFTLTNNYSYSERDKEVKNFINKCMRDARFQFKTHIYYYGMGDKSRQKFNGASNYTNFTSDEIPIVCYDATLFGSAKDGFVLTTKGIHSNKFLPTSKFITYQDMELKYINKKIYINDMLANTDVLLKSDREKVYHLIKQCRRAFSTKIYLDDVVEDLINDCRNTPELNFKSHIYYYDNNDVKAKKKFKAALSSYARFTKDELPIVCYDATLFGGGKDGFVISTKGIHLHNFLEDTKFFYYQNINNIQLNQDIYINNDKVNIVINEQKPYIYKLLQMCFECFNK